MSEFRQMKKTGTMNSDTLCRLSLMIVASLAAVVVISIVVFIAREGADAFSSVGISEFLTGDEWRPTYGTYGAAPLIAGTLLVTAGAMAVCCPLGIGTAIFLSEVAPGKVRKVLKPVFEIMAGIPSVVYGLLGMLVLVPLIADVFAGQTDYGGYSWLAGSILLGIMALPEVISVSDDALQTVPQSYREASLAVGATRWETTTKVVVPAAASGISAAVILGMGRAIGETMAVMVVTGNTAIYPDPAWDVFSPIRTITATLAIEMPEVVVGSTHYSSLFLLALILMIMILLVNLAVRFVIKRSTAKFNGTLKETRFTLFMENADPQKVKNAKDFSIAVIVAVIVYMAATLFTNNVNSIIAAAVVVAAWKLGQYAYSKHLARRYRALISKALLTCVAGIVLAILAYIIVDIFWNAMPALSIDFITEDPVRGGREGGIYPAIIGSIELLIGTAIIAVPLGILTGVYLSEYGGNGKITRVITEAVNILNGTPSIVFGLFGMIIFVTYLHWGFCLIAGCVTLALMVMPVVIRTTQEAIDRVPDSLREASRALGATKAQTTFRVVIPAAISGIMTGSILGLARSIGETAPIMFTAVVVRASVDDYGLFDPIMALPYHLYYLATEGRADPSMMYATAAVLLVLVLAMFAVASVVRVHGEKKLKP